jgi:hypothetical protein
MAGILPVPSLKDSPAEKTSAPHTVNGAAAVIIADKKLL